MNKVCKPDSSLCQSSDLIWSSITPFLHFFFTSQQKCMWNSAFCRGVGSSLSRRSGNWTNIYDLNQISVHIFVNIKERTQIQKNWAARCAAKNTQKGSSSWLWGAAVRGRKKSFFIVSAAATAAANNDPKRSQPGSLCLIMTIVLADHLHSSQSNYMSELLVVLSSSSLPPFTPTFFECCWRARDLSLSNQGVDNLTGMGETEITVCCCWQWETLVSCHQFSISF